MAAVSKKTSGHRVLITGASRGIGLAIAGTLARRGDHVILVARRRETLLEAVGAIREAGGTVDYLCGDVGTATKAEKLAVRALKKFPDIDTLILNAGLARHHRFEDASSEDLKAEFDTNYFAPAALARAFLASPVGKAGGRLVILGSLTAEIPFPGHANYSASKAAAAQLFRSLQVEWKNRKMQISIVLPGLTDTEMVRGLKSALPSASPQSVADAVVKCLDEGLNEIVPGWDNRLTLQFSRYFPETFHALLTRTADALVPGYRQLQRGADE